MITKEQLQSAIEAGILDESTAAALKAHKPNTGAHHHIVDEEYFRLVSGFNDIFVVIACILFFISLALIGDVVIGAASIAIAAWGLAEFFVLKRRMALPAIVLLLSFVGGVFVFSESLVIGTKAAATSSDKQYLTILAYGISIIAAYLHWKRFKVPITIAAGAAFAVATIITTITWFTTNETIIMPLVSLSGLTVFAFAMYWDAADTKRETRKSDIGFWLHLLAAPLIIHPVFELLDVLNQNINIFETVIVLGLYLVIAIISLAIDRRAPMVSALGYVIYALNTLLSNVAAGEKTGFTITAFIIGAALLVLSAFWHQCRKITLQFVPENIKQYLPR